MYLAGSVGVVSAGFQGGSTAAGNTAAGVAPLLGSATLGFQGGAVAATVASAAAAVEAALGVGVGAEGRGAVLVNEDTGLTLTAGEDRGVLAVAEPALGGCTVSDGLAAGLFLLRDPHPPTAAAAAAS